MIDLQVKTNHEGHWVVAEYDLMPFSTPQLAAMASQIADMAYRKGQDDLREQLNALLKG